MVVKRRVEGAKTPHFLQVRVHVWVTKNPDQAKRTWKKASLPRWEERPKWKSGNSWRTTFRKCVFVCVEREFSGNSGEDDNRNNKTTLLPWQTQGSSLLKDMSLLIRLLKGKLPKLVCYNLICCLCLDLERKDKTSQREYQVPMRGWSLIYSLTASPTRGIIYQTNKTTSFRLPASGVVKSIKKS